MDLDFLPKLPSSNLDDRSFDDLVEECRLRIPRYCPEWTDHNLSDPGITMIEMFAWLTDQMLMRFNQVPRKNYVAFLEMLGIRLKPPAPALTDLTFYLTASRPSPWELPEGIEVATARTSAQEAVVFRSDRPLPLGYPRLSYILTSREEDENGIPQSLSDRISDDWDKANETFWFGREKEIFDPEPRSGNSLYLVLEPDQNLQANVLALSFQGPAATPTGIDPNHPPRRWEAWTGETWESVLLQESDDRTRGFSFHERNPVQGADVILHLPYQWPATQLYGFYGCWLRCRVVEPEERRQSTYSQSPRLSGIGVRSIGGTVPASQCTAIEGEQLGTSNGNPGQSFQLQRTPILERQPNEYLLVTPPNGLPQRWREVPNFADSGPEDLHYTIDSPTGVVQFGPLIREPGSLRDQTRDRTRQQAPQPLPALSSGEVSNPATAVIDVPARRASSLERQYGAVPPPGSTISMVRYRTGGGKAGNVQANTLRFLRTSVPYVDSVTNRTLARYGRDQESLEEAILRAPSLLRSRDRAVTVEDFEALTVAAGKGSVVRVRCLTPTETEIPGTVRLLVVPHADRSLIDQEQGIAPEQLALNQSLREQIMTYLDDRRLLGIRLDLAEPGYVGVQVRTQIKLRPQYDNPEAQEIILSRLRVALYDYLNPLTGGPDKEGWPFGQPVYASNIMALLQKAPEVLYVGRVRLFELRKTDDDTWPLPQLAPPDGASADGECVRPGALGLVCSWQDRQLRCGHRLDLVSDEVSG